jgi:lipoate-protein ligase A
MLRFYGMADWTVLDTGARSAAENVALDDAVLKARNRGDVPNTLRFLQYNPHAVLVGYHQCVEQEVRLEYCEEHGIDINRRITGGGAIYFDEPQLGWELIASKSDPCIPKDVEDIYERLCQCAVRGIKKLGVDAAFRPKNDIEVNGRKISGTGGALEGDAFLFQGTLLTDFDVGTMLRALRIPVEKLKDKEMDEIKERVTCLKWELDQVPTLNVIKKALVRGFEEELGVQFEPRVLSPGEMRAVEEGIDYYKSEEWVYSVRRPPKHRHVLRSVYKAPGGLIRVSLVANLANRKIPKRLIMDMESALKDFLLDMGAIEGHINTFFDSREWQIPGVGASDFISAIRRAYEKLDYMEMGVPLENVNAIFPVIGELDDFKESTALLLPYCAKLAECDLRHTKQCTECGKCSIGDAYALAKERGLEPITITSFEDLMETLEQLKTRGAKAFIGSCCEAFYAKHLEDFQEAGLPGIMVDIDNDTCYELEKEEDALLGKFESQTELKFDLLKQIIEKLCGK